MDEYVLKREQLHDIMKNYARGDVAVAFSGGVDSTLLLKMACEAAETTGSHVYALTVQTRLHPAGEIQESKEICRQIGARHIVMSVDELKEAGIADNPVDRCYLCKRYLFKKMMEKAAGFQVKVVIEGTNEDDLHVYRPGIKALQELGIKSPLASAGMTKAEVRRLAAEYGLSTAVKPSKPCLATRFPYGTPLDYVKIAQVEKGEAYLKAFGLYNVRLRVHENIARIEVDEDEFEDIMSHKREITAFLKQLGFVYITLDLDGFRSGSMDVEIENKVI